jgi:redox-sensitive bicupin YhaK (pirin superfamily)
LTDVIDVRRAADRFTTEDDGIRTRHSFSFGRHYDPANVGLAALVAHNDDRLAPGAGYPSHPHRDLEIVTWVLEGALEHQDSRGHGGLVHPGLVQRLSAGSGVRHSERNDPRTGAATRFVQMWVRPDRTGLDPSYAQADVTDALAAGGLVPVASGSAGVDAAVRLHAPGTVLHVARLRPRSGVDLPDAAHLHVFVARGRADVEGVGRLDEGDAVRFAGAGSRRLVADGPAEVLVWELA